MTIQNTPRIRKPLQIELPDDIRAFLDERKEVLGASYKGTLTAAVRHFRDAIQAADIGADAIRQAAVDQLVKVMTKAALAGTEPKQDASKPKAKRKAKAQAGSHDQPANGA